VSVRAAAIISDIHGNSLALRAVLADIDERGLETVYCLGDPVGYGLDPNGVIDLIRSRGIPTIQGNYDDGVGWERGDCGCFYATAEAKRLGDASYAFTVREVTDDRKAFLRELPPDRHITLDGVAVHLVHGSPRRMNEYLLRDRDERTFRRLAEAETDDVLVFGHTHDPWWRMMGGVLFVNVGSVGRPKDGDPRAMYSVLRSAARRQAPVGEAPTRRTGTTGEAAHPPVEVESVRVPYDFEATAAGIEAAGLPRELAEAVRTGA
jgi:putative phosphoesterase